MRKSTYIIPLLIAAMFAPAAHADSLYTATFTCTGTCLSTPPATTPDVTFPPPVVLDVTWNGLSILLALSPGDLPTDVYSWVAGENEEGNGLDFLLRDVTTSSVAGASFVFSAPPNYSEGGSVTFTAVVTPEPSSVGLMLLGTGFVFVMRKRICKAASLHIWVDSREP